MSNLFKILIVTGIAHAVLLGCSPHPRYLEKSIKSSAKKSLKSVQKMPDVHEVVKGETLYAIAWRYGKDYRVLAKSNGIDQRYRIYPGQKLHLNAGSKQHKKTTHKPSKKSSNTGSKNDASLNKKVNAPLNETVSSAGNVSRRKVSRADKKMARSKKATKPSLKETSKSTEIGWQWPVSGQIIKRFSTAGALSKGIDFGGELGEPVRAAAAGKVVYSGTGLRGYGKLLIVKHNEKYLSAYAHNRKLLVKEGATVKAGQKIAEMGDSGAQDVRLHFEIRFDGKPVDPILFLPKYAA